jgi:hypothetical protein
MSVASSASARTGALQRLDEAGNDRRVDRVGLCPSTDRLGKVADARRVDHRDRQAGRAQRRRHDRFIAARRLDTDTDQMLPFLCAGANVRI